MKYNNLDNFQDDYYDFLEFKISTEDIISMEGPYSEPLYDLSKAISNSITSKAKFIKDKVNSYLDNRSKKRFIIEKIKEKLKDDFILDRLLSNDLIKVKLAKIDDEYYVKIKAKSDDKIKYYLISHQLGRDGSAEFEEFKDKMKNLIPSLIRKAKKEHKLNIANESTNSLLNTFGKLYGEDKLEELKKLI